MRTTRVNSYVLFALLSTCGTGIGEEIRLQPDDLAAGDRYRLAFVTSALTTATSDKIATYNEFVQATADAAPEVGAWGLQWKAIASTVDVDARDNSATNPEVDESVPIYLVNGDLLIPDYDALWFGPLHPDLADSLRFNVTELGDRLLEDTPDRDGRYVWTGTDQYGTGLVFGGLGPLGTSLATVGDADDAPGAWFDDAAIENTELEYPLYAISEVITAVPEPSSPMLLTFIVLLTRMRVRRRH